MGLQQLQLFARALGIGALLLTLTTPMAATAQIQATSEPLTITLGSDAPGSYDKTTAKAESFNVDLQTAILTWTLDGKHIERGAGKTKVEFATGAPGKTMTLKAAASLPSGEVVSNTLSLTPQDVDLIAEAQTYVHPFYKSKSLLPPSGKVKLIAIPHIKTANGTSVDRNSLIYTWKEGAKVLGSISGAGRHTVTIDGPQLLREKFMQLEVSSPDRKLRARNTMTLKPFAQQVALYEHNPLLGVLFHKAITGAQSYQGRELRLASFPYFFTAETRNSGELSSTWRLNGSRVEEDSIENGILTLSPEGRGKATIEHEVSGVTQVLERGGTRIDLSFEQTSSE